MLESHTILHLKDIACIIRDGFYKIQIGFMTAVLIVNTSNIYLFYISSIESNF